MSLFRGLCCPEAFFGAYSSLGRVFHGLWVAFALIALASALNYTYTGCRKRDKYGKNMQYFISYYKLARLQ